MLRCSDCRGGCEARVPWGPFPANFDVHRLDPDIRLTSKPVKLIGF